MTMRLTYGITILIFILLAPQYALANNACNVQYVIEQQWGNGFTASVKVTHQGYVLDGWQVQWDMPDNQQITGLWNGQMQQSGSQVTVTHYNWNRTVNNGGHIQFGFNGSYQGSNTLPGNIRLNGTLCSGQTAAAPEEPQAVACTAHYNVVQKWNGGFQAQVQIDNTGSDLQDWQLRWTQPDGQQITGLWSGHWQQNGAAVQVTPANWNAQLPANSQLQLGFNANTSSDYTIPLDITLNDVLCEGQQPPPEPVIACHVDYQIREQWNTGFTSDVVIQNTGDEWQNWQVSWTMPLQQTVTQAWNVQAQQNGDQVTATAVDWNQYIAADGTLSFGFNGSHNGINPSPIDLAVNGVRCTGQADSVLLPPQQPTDFNAEVQANTSIQLMWSDVSEQESQFLLQRKANEQSWQDLRVLAANSTQFEDLTVGTGITYQYRLASENATGRSTFVYSQQLALQDRNAISSRDLVNTCAGCHATDGVSQGPAIPSIAGLGRDYLEHTLQDYQLGSRYASMMPRIAKGYTDAQIEQISEHFSSLAFVAAAQSFDMQQVTQGLTLHRERCAQCHTDGGRERNQTGVVLAGQWQAYLEAEIQSYQLGLSSNAPPGMLAQLAGLSAQEIQALSYYYAANLSDEEIEGNNNQAPVAVDDQRQILQNQGTTLAVLSNDSDPENQPLTLVAVGSAAHGSVSIVNQQWLYYQPHADYLGHDSFDYEIRDSGGLSATANVQLEIIADTGMQVPSPVSNLNASVIENTRIQLDWQNSSAVADGIRITRKGAQQIWITLQELPADSTQYTDTDVNAGDSYDYAVTAFNAYGDSEPVTVYSQLLPLSEHGQNLYSTYNCHACHGNNGEGGLSNKPLNHFSRDDQGYLISAIELGMPPSDPSLCDNQCATALTEYILSAFSDHDPGQNSCTDVPPASPRSLRLLTRQEYENTVNALLGLSENLVYALAEENRVAGFDNNIQQNLVTGIRLEAYLNLAESLAEKAVAEQRHVLLSCTTQDSNCANEFIAQFGKRAFRRPLSNEEISRYEQLFTDNSFDDALQHTVMSLLSSPHFLYRHELGELQNDGNYRLNAYETASLLSYLFWGSMPDDALFTAADNDQLQTAEQRLTQANRLLNDPRARTQSGLFAGQWLLSSSPYTLPDKSSDVYPAYTSAVKSALSQELIAFYNHVLFDSSASFTELYQSNYVLIDNVLADYYGLQHSGGSQFEVTPVNDNTRHGLLTLGAVMARYANSNESHPFKRGAFLFERLLCHELPEPANMGVVIAPVIDPDATTRERFSFHSESDTSCYECHQYIDGPGFAFENYDGAGQYRSSENQQPIDSSGVLRGLETFTPDETLAFSDLTQLSEILANSTSAAHCVARQYYRYSTGRLEDTNDQCAMQNFLDAYESNAYNLKTLLLELVASEEFIYRRAQ